MPMPRLRIGERVRVSTSGAVLADTPEFTIDVVEESRFWIEAPERPMRWRPLSPWVINTVSHRPWLIAAAA